MSFCEAARFFLAETLGFKLDTLEVRDCLGIGSFFPSLPVGCFSCIAFRCFSCWDFSVLFIFLVPTIGDWCSNLGSKPFLELVPSMLVIQRLSVLAISSNSEGSSCLIFQKSSSAFLGFFMSLARTS